MVVALFLSRQSFAEFYALCLFRSPSSSCLSLSVCLTAIFLLSLSGSRLFRVACRCGFSNYLPRAPFLLHLLGTRLGSTWWCVFYCSQFVSLLLICCRCGETLWHTWYDYTMWSPLVASWVESSFRMLFKRSRISVFLLFMSFSCRTKQRTCLLSCSFLLTVYSGSSKLPTICSS